jgi:hypothetical protein
MREFLAWQVVEMVNEQVAQVRRFVDTGYNRITLPHRPPQPRDGGSGLGR